ncbi:Calponin homology domain [Dillenia turbinata]|uniref:Calponin homology domain n=1 Tax=Dillenia turbinata TaxID=194707 RepID=A0AAN8UUC3_9MAGN
MLAMATTEGIVPFSAEMVVEDVLKQHGTRLSDIDFASRKAEEASLRRYEAAGWLRKTVGVAGGNKDLPAEPSEEEFRLGLRSGIILCNALNKVQPGAVPKVVEGPCDSVIIPDGAALSAYQYFENLRNFLVNVEEMGIPTFEASDLEQGGKTARVVNCVLALKSYCEWKQGGGIGLWKFSGNIKPTGSGKYFFRKNSELFMNSLRASSLGEKSLEGLASEHYSNDELGNEMSISQSIGLLVRSILSSKKPEEVPAFVESMFNKVMEEFECRLASRNAQTKETPTDTAACCQELFLANSVSDETQTKETPTDTAACRQEQSLANSVADETQGDLMEDTTLGQTMEVEYYDYEQINGGGSKGQHLKQLTLFEQQQRDIQELKSTLHTTKAGVKFMQMRCQEDFNVIAKHLHSLAHAVSGYQKVLEENRKLYNQVMDLKGNIRVYCRVRPFLGNQPNSFGCVDHIDEGNIAIITPSKYGKEGRKLFSFNKVFGPAATQAEVFSDTQPLIRSVLDGYNVCIFAYGQTGSGKTYTMTGPKELTEEGLGVNYRALSDLFHISQERRHTFSYTVSVQMLEIYNEQVRDLLATDGSIKKYPLNATFSQSGINVPDANIVPVSSPSDVIYLMNLGHKNRAVSSTAMNDRSSRSHSCLTVHVQGKDLTSGTTLRGCLHLVDLAGSERVDKSEVTGDRLKEAQHINKSLAALGDVIASLSSKNSHVPYRNSKLTQLLQDSLGGQAKTLMFVHISPEPDALGETLSTLKFAERVATVELGAAKVNKDNAEIKELKEQIANLKAALARKEGEPERLRSTISMNPERYAMKPRSNSSLSANWHSAGDTFAVRRQLMDEAGNIENIISPSPKRQSLDPQDMLASSPPLPFLSGGSLLDDQKEDSKEDYPGDWIDKTLGNRQDVGRQGNSLGQCLDDNNLLPDMFYQGHIPNPSKIFPEQPLNKLLGDWKDNQDSGLHRTRSDAALSHDSDDVEVSSTHSSDPDMNWQSNVARVTSIPTIGAKSKKNHTKPARGTDTRSSIPSLIPSPSLKLSNGVSPSSHRVGRHSLSTNGKRRAGSGK